MTLCSKHPYGHSSRPPLGGPCGALPKASGGSTRPGLFQAGYLFVQGGAHESKSFVISVNYGVNLEHNNEF